DKLVTGVQTCALPIWAGGALARDSRAGTNGVVDGRRRGGAVALGVPRWRAGAADRRLRLVDDDRLEPRIAPNPLDVVLVPERERSEERRVGKERDTRR